MTNAEKWKDQILNKIDNCDEFAVINGMPGKCKESNCDICKFYNSEVDCLRPAVRWMLETYIEHPKLTKQQHAFCEAFPDMWLADSISSGAVLYSEKPEISSTDMFRLYIPHECTIMIIPEKIISFPFMKPFIESGELYNTSEMLKWEMDE